MVDRRHLLAPGEKGVCACISPTRAQARVVLDYAKGFIDASPIMRGEVKSVDTDEIVFKNGNTIATLSNDFRSLRGRTLLIAILDEAAYLRDEASANPDIEAARALMPGLMTTGGMLVVMSSPYRRQGLLHQLHRDFYAKDDNEVLVVQGTSKQFNPTLSDKQIEAASAKDPAAAGAEWRGEFRNDLQQFLDEELIEAAIDRDRPLELPPRSGVIYHAFADMSAGRHDASAISIAHREGERIVIDLVRGRRAPHDPAEVAEEFLGLAKGDYRCSKIIGDNYAGEWVAAAFKSAHYTQAELTKSELFLEGLPLFTRGALRMPAHKQLLTELRLLERRTSRSGRDSVGHPSGGAAVDDFANAMFGAIYLASQKPKGMAAIPRANMQRAIARMGAPSYGSFSLADHIRMGGRT